MEEEEEGRKEGRRTMTQWGKKIEGEIRGEEENKEKRKWGGRYKEEVGKWEK